MKIMLNYTVLNEIFKYKCHIREVDDLLGYQTHFVHDDIHFFDENGTIKASTSTEFQKGVKLLILSRLESAENITEEVSNFPKPALDAIRKKAKKVTNPEKTLLDREHSAIYEKERYATPKRKQYEEEYVSSGRRLQGEIK